MNLSIFNNRTTAAALKRNGQACLALNAGGYRLDGKEWRGGNPATSTPVISTLAKSVSFCSNFGGSPSIGTPAPQGLALDAFRMHAAPLTLDSSAKQQEGDA